ARYASIRGWRPTRNRAVAGTGSAQLAVLAATTVVEAGAAALFVMRLLAGHAQAYAGHGLAPRGRNGGVALFAASQARTLAQLLPRPLHRIADRGVDLILHGTITCPTGCHGIPPHYRCIRTLIRTRRVPSNDHASERPVSMGLRAQAVDIAQLAQGFGFARFEFQAGLVGCSRVVQSMQLHQRVALSAQSLALQRRHLRRTAGPADAGIVHGVPVEFQ